MRARVRERARKFRFSEAPGEGLRTFRFSGRAGEGLRKFRFSVREHARTFRFNGALENVQIQWPCRERLEEI